MRCVGPKCSIFFLVLSSWGVLMLLLMGVFARVNAVSFADDIPLDEREWAKQGYPPHAIDDAYVLMSNNCFIAAGVYAIILAISALLYHYNKKTDYMIH